MSFVAECEQCGVIERGEFEAVGDAAEDHVEHLDGRPLAEWADDVDIERGEEVRVA